MEKTNLVNSTKAVNNHSVIEAINENLNNPENLKIIMADYPEIFLKSQKYLKTSTKKICEPIINQYGEINKSIEYINYNTNTKETKASTASATTKPKIDKPITPKIFTPKKEFGKIVEVSW